MKPIPKEILADHLQFRRDLLRPPRLPGGYWDERAPSEAARLQQLLQPLFPRVNALADELRAQHPDWFKDEAMRIAEEKILDQLSEDEKDQLHVLTDRLRDKNERLRRSQEKALAIQNCQELMQRAVQETLNGDPDWGAFLGELIPFLTKRVEELEQNESFKARFLEIKHSRQPRQKGKSLRSILEEITEEGTRRWKWFHVLGDSALAQYKGFDLSHLPCFYSQDCQPAAADQWFDQFHWPVLLRMKSELRDIPQIGGLKRANRISGKRSGKFQLSDLNDRARDVVKRLALRGPYFLFIK